MKTLIAVFASLLLLASPARAEEDLPQSCAITAAIATTKLTQAGIWARPLGLSVVKPDGKTAGHIMTAFSFDGHTYVYDIEGSHQLKTGSTDIKVIVEEIQSKLQPGWKITAYKWLDEK